jgi:hypothetical protein
MGFVVAINLLTGKYVVGAIALSALHVPRHLRQKGRAQLLLLPRWRPKLMPVGPTMSPYKATFGYPV